MKKLAFLSMDSLHGHICSDELLYSPLQQQGWLCELVSWHNKEINWSEYDAVLIRSTWDYQNDPAAFIRTLERIEQSPARLENKIELVRWNMDKCYLRDLELADVTIVPTVWISEFSNQQMMECFESFATDEIIIKPNISANANNTFRLTQEQAKKFTPKLEEIFKCKNHMIQPLMQNIINEGEFSVFFFADEYSHAVLKKPKAQDFRVQEEYGGILTLVTPEKSLLDCARQVLQAVSPKPLYSRIDFVRYDNGFALMELEIIEPSLYLNMDPASPQRFAKQFAQWMNQQAIV